MIGEAAVRLRQRLPAWPAVAPIDRRSTGKTNTDKTNTGKNMAIYLGAQRISQARADRARLHLGRGRRAREAGRFEVAAREARRALVQQPTDPWAHALLGQVLLRQRRPNLAAARRELEQACALSPTNGYFVGLLREVLTAEGDAAGCREMIARAWWSGAPVERWLEGAPRRKVAVEPAARPSIPTPTIRLGAHAGA